MRNSTRGQATSQPTHQRVLVVEDDVSLGQMIVEFLSKFEFYASIHSSGVDAARRILDESPDVVLLDINLPGSDGFSICRKIREEYAGIVIMLSARGEEFDEVLGLESGADDYLSKPVSPRVLLARLRMHLRRSGSNDADVTNGAISAGSLSVCPASRSVTLNGKDIALTTAEFDLLRLLACRSGKTVDRNDLYLELTGLEYDGRDRSIDLRVSRLRKKLGDNASNPRIIKAVRGIGYLLAPPL